MSVLLGILEVTNKITLLIFISVLAMGYAGDLYAQHRLFIKKGQNDYSIDQYISILKDKDSKLTTLQAASDSMKNKYVYYDKKSLNFGFTNSTYWIRLIVVDTISNPSSITANKNTSTWLLVKNDPILEDARFFYRDLSGTSNNFIEKRAGSIFPDAKKAIKTNDFIAAFPVRKNIPDTLYLRAKSASQFILSFDMLTSGEYIIRSLQKNIFEGISFGIFFLLIAYNTILYFSIRNKVYLYYVLYIASFALFIFIFQGYYSELIGIIFSRDYYVLPLITITITGTTWLLLTREFLSTKSYLPGAYKLLSYLTPAAPIICFFIIFFSVSWLTAVLATCFLVYYTIGIIIAVMSLKKGVYIARYYLLAISGITICIFLSVTNRNNFLPLPWNFWTLNILSIGILWEALILAATVGYRFNYLRIEKEREKGLIRSQIAADLHDEVGSYLSTISLQSRLMISDKKLDNNLKEQLKDIIKIAGTTTETMRDIVWFINPFHDNSEDMFFRMKELASKMLLNLNYIINLKGGDKNIFDAVPDLNKRRNIYLIYKEALNNITKHSEADSVNIMFSKDDENFKMLIADNGKGFDKEKIVQGEGLNNFKRRSEQIGAKFFIESKEGKGTKITLKVPI
jgi:signal transduction histidine kinase